MALDMQDLFGIPDNYIAGMRRCELVVLNRTCGSYCAWSSKSKTFDERFRLEEGSTNKSCREPGCPRSSKPLSSWQALRGHYASAHPHAPPPVCSLPLPRPLTKRGRYYLRQRIRNMDVDNSDTDEPNPYWAPPGVVDNRPPRPLLASPASPQPSGPRA